MNFKAQISKAQIIATVGPSCRDVATLVATIAHQMDGARLNLAWGSQGEHAAYIKAIREAEKISARKILIIVDLPGPRIQNVGSHGFDASAISAITDEDKTSIAFAVSQAVDYIALSFVGNADDVLLCRKIIHECGGKQPIIAKIERAVALETLDQIIAVADAVMVARGDLGNEVPLERIPFIQDRIIQSAKKARKPVIVATQMLLSMTENPLPTRAEVTDVAYAILEGADAVMLSEETAKGKYPVEAVAMMEKIVIEAEKHMAEKNI